jgi:hypothetical protein
MISAPASARLKWLLPVAVALANKMARKLLRSFGLTTADIVSS